MVIGKRKSQLSHIINTDMLHLVVTESVCLEIPIKQIIKIKCWQMWILPLMIAFPDVHDLIKSSSLISGLLGFLNDILDVQKNVCTVHGKTT